MGPLIEQEIGPETEQDDTHDYGVATGVRWVGMRCIGEDSGVLLWEAYTVDSAT